MLVNKYSPRKAQAAYLALWWATLKNSTPIVSDKVNTFHDAWHKGHMTAPSVVENYTPAGMKAIEQNMQVVSPPIYLTGYLEFQDLLGEEPVGSLCRPVAGQGRAVSAPTERVERRRQPHRPRQAQGGAGELQGGDAEEGQAGLAVCHNTSVMPRESGASSIPRRVQ